MQAAQRSWEGRRTRLPDWAADLSAALESGACGQFVLHGNVHDRFTIAGRFVGIDRFVEDEMLGRTDVIFSYDLGNGLAVRRSAWRLHTDAVELSATPVIEPVGSTDASE
jgi:hypothetical protein